VLKWRFIPFGRRVVASRGPLFSTGSGGLVRSGVPRGTTVPVFGAQESKILHIYLRGVSGLAVLPLPLTVPKAALHIDFVPFAEVFFTDFRGLVPDHYIVPFGLGDLFPTLFIGESFIGGQGKPAHTAAPFKIVDLHIIP